MGLQICLNNKDHKMFRIMKKNVIPWLVSHLAAVMVIFLLPGGCLKEEVPYLTLSEEGDIEME